MSIEQAKHKRSSSRQDELQNVRALYVFSKEGKGIHESLHMDQLRTPVRSEEATPHSASHPPPGPPPPALPATPRLPATPGLQSPTRPVTPGPPAPYMAHYLTHPHTRPIAPPSHPARAPIACREPLLSAGPHAWSGAQRRSPRVERRAHTPRRLERRRARRGSVVAKCSGLEAAWGLHYGCVEVAWRWRGGCVEARWRRRGCGVGAALGRRGGSLGAAWGRHGACVTAARRHRGAGVTAAWRLRGGCVGAVWEWGLRGAAPERKKDVLIVCCTCRCA